MVLVRQKLRGVLLKTLWICHG